MESLKVLIVDDDSLIRMDLRVSLESLGYEVVGEAGDGKQAVDLARSLHPDVVVMDVVMPQMDGLEAARILRQEQIAPVVMLSGFGEEDLVGRANAAGVMAYLRKPLRQDELAPTMAMALGRHRERRDLEREIDSLKEKMEARKIVGRAKALLMEKYNLTEREAFHRIQNKSQTMQKPAHEIAKAIIMASELGV